MQFIQQQLAQVGVKVTVTPLEAGVEAQRIWSVQKPEDAMCRCSTTGWSSSRVMPTGRCVRCVGQGLPAEPLQRSPTTRTRRWTRTSRARWKPPIGKRGAFYVDAQKRIDGKTRRGSSSGLAAHHGPVEVPVRRLHAPDRGFVVETPEFK